MKLNQTRVHRIQDLIAELESVRDLKRTLLYAGFLTTKTSIEAKPGDLRTNIGKYGDRLFLLDLWAKFEINLEEIKGINDDLIQKLRLNLSQSIFNEEPHWALVGLKILYFSPGLPRPQRISVLFFNNLYNTMIRPLHRFILEQTNIDQKTAILKTNEMIKFLGFSFYPMELLEIEDKAFDQSIHKEIRKEISRKVPHGAILSVHALGVKYLDEKIIMMPEVITAIHD